MKYYNHYKKLSKGFTIIELLVVISIISLLSSVILASLNSARTRATKTAFVQDVKEFQTALEMYKDSTGSYPGEISDGLGFTESSALTQASDYLRDVNFIPNNISKFPSALFNEDYFMYATGLNSAYTCGLKEFSGFILIYFNIEGSGDINLPTYSNEGVPSPSLYCVTGN